MANNIDHRLTLTFNSEEDLTRYTLTYKEGLDIEKFERYYKSDGTRDWSEDNIGAKWAYVARHETEGNKLHIMVVSAWAEVRQLLSKYRKMVKEETNIDYDTEGIAIDEMGNFGYSIYNDMWTEWTNEEINDYFGFEIA